ncbi:MAG TPA: PH domain-containing protein [Gammaproteobacteria bacterium]|nr:PH domain-containing protein [Gammaproteobacteria bacterium]
MSNGNDNGTSFPLAPMSPLMLTLTTVIYAVTAIIVIGALAGATALAIPAVLIAVLYAWIWLRFRPTRFTVHTGGLAIEWPMRRVEIPLADIADARILDKEQLKTAIGWGLRVGAGGLWGGFGRLWTKHRGLIHLYISRTDRFVWIERRHGKPWLITPDRPEEFVVVIDRQSTPGTESDMDTQK